MFPNLCTRESTHGQQTRHTTKLEIFLENLHKKGEHMETHTILSSISLLQLFTKFPNLQYKSGICEAASQQCCYVHGKTFVPFIYTYFPIVGCSVPGTGEIEDQEQNQWQMPNIPVSHKETNKKRKIPKRGRSKAITLTETHIKTKKK
jgi:hypothetical protein